MQWKSLSAHSAKLISRAYSRSGDYALSIALRMTVFIRIITSRDQIITSVGVVQFATFFHFVNTTTTWIMEFPGVAVNNTFHA